MPLQDSSTGEVLSVQLRPVVAVQTEATQVSVPVQSVDIVQGEPVATFPTSTQTSSEQIKKSAQVTVALQSSPTVGLATHMVEVKLQYAL